MDEKRALSRAKAASRNNHIHILAAVGHHHIRERGKINARFIDELFNKAIQGDKFSASWLVDLANHAVVRVREFTEEQFANAREIARRNEFWPTALTYRDPFVLDGTELAKRLEIGAHIRGPFSFDEDFRGSTDARKIVAFLIDLTSRFAALGFARAKHRRLKKLERFATKSDDEKFRKYAELLTAEREEARKDLYKHETIIVEAIQAFGKVLEAKEHLPKAAVSALAEAAFRLRELSNDSVKDWFGLGKKIVMAWFENHPEKNAILRGLGWHRRHAHLQKAFPPGAELEKRKKTDVGSASSETNIRDGLFERIRATYPTVVKYLTQNERVV